ncbi:hypothetical protein CKM354_000122700 [Cercospora kikuchii]|uniref:Uncharacterized protein n=1 Tax=Cercospora kikuchii TaxID=84275 RepID=A0A9P3CAI7_9PEZI|nr:uncharacterized protein CKM354_000122700 [Cercospora kikuchii]GIZ37792.1 hypothetical protein CKM354_000122700 [Cercospora kikuchii]
MAYISCNAVTGATDDEAVPLKSINASLSSQHLLSCDPKGALQHTQTRSAATSINDLPAEMRNQIYENVAMVIREDTTDWILCLLSAKRQTHREAGLIILRSKAFSFAITTSLSITEGGSCDGLRHRLASIPNVVANSACRIATYLEDLTDISILSLALVILTVVRSERTIDVGRIRLTMKEAAMGKHGCVMSEDDRKVAGEIFHQMLQLCLEEADALAANGLPLTIKRASESSHA